MVTLALFFIISNSEGGHGVGVVVEWLLEAGAVGSAFNTIYAPAPARPGFQKY